MSCEFSHKRVVAVASLPDASPNTTPPGAANILRLQKNPPNGEDEAHRVMFYVVADNSAAGTFTWALWVFDTSGSTWVLVDTGAGTADRVAVSKEVPVEADCFVQITAPAGFAGATSLTTHATEQA